MIIDNIKNAHLYYNLNSDIKKALQFLQEHDFKKMEDGRYEIDGSNVYALVQSYNTKPDSEGKWEAHQKYIDVQYVASGSERMGYCNIEQMEISQQYNEEDDFLLFEGEGNFVKFTPGMFTIFYPQDVHMPGLQLEWKEKIKKVVVKVKVDKNN